MSKYIKVELKDKSKHIVLAANEAFYKAQGAKISEPTQKEVDAAFPVDKENKGVKEFKDIAVVEMLEKENADLKAENAELKAENTTLLEANEALKAENATLKNTETEKPKK